MQTNIGWRRMRNVAHDARYAVAAYAKWPTDNHDNPEDTEWWRKVAQKGLEAALEDRNRTFDDSVLQV